MSIILVTMIRLLLFLLRKESLAAARHLPARRPDGSPWKYRTVLPPHIGRLLDAHMDTLGGIDKKDSANLFFDISQKPDYRKKTRGKVLLALMQKTLLFNVGHERCLLPEEHLEVMGWPAFAPRGSTHCLPWPEALPSMSSAAIRSVAGNGMHLGALGSVLMYLLGFTQEA